jgi:hypothetical protein
VGAEIFESLFVVADPLNNRAFRVEYPDLTAEEIETLHSGPSWKGGPVRAAQFMGFSRYDVIWTGHIKPFIVRQRVVDLLRPGA